MTVWLKVNKALTMCWLYSIEQQVHTCITELADTTGILSIPHPVGWQLGKHSWSFQPLWRAQTVVETEPTCKGSRGSVQQENSDKVLSVRRYRVRLTQLCVTEWGSAVERPGVGLQVQSYFTNQYRVSLPCYGWYTIWLALTEIHTPLNYTNPLGFVCMCALVCVAFPVETQYRSHGTCPHWEYVPGKQCVQRDEMSSITNRSTLSV